MEQGSLLSETPEEESPSRDGDHGSAGRGQHQPGGLGEDHSADGVQQDGRLGQDQTQQADGQDNRK